MKPIKIRSAKFFKHVRPSRDQLNKVDIGFSHGHDREIWFHPNFGVIVNRYCTVDKKVYQFIIPVNNIEAIVPLEDLKFDSVKVKQPEDLYWEDKIMDKQKSEYEKKTKPKIKEEKVAVRKSAKK